MECIQNILVAWERLVINNMEVSVIENRFKWQHVDYAVKSNYPPLTEP